MAVKYVDLVSGNDTTGDGSAGNPYKTIYKGSTGLSTSGGDEVRVAKTTDTLLTGTVTLSAGSSTLTGSGTLFTSELVVGDFIAVNDLVYEVNSISSNTSLVLKWVRATQTQAGSGYSIYKIGYVSATGLASTTKYQELNTSCAITAVSRNLCSGGWDLSTTTQTGRTRIKNDGTQGYGYGLYTDEIGWKIEYFDFYRFRNGIISYGDNIWIDECIAGYGKTSYGFQITGYYHKLTNSCVIGNDSSGGIYYNGSGFYADNIEVNLEYGISNNCLYLYGLNIDIRNSNFYGGSNGDCVSGTGCPTFRNCTFNWYTYQIFNMSNTPTVYCYNCSNPYWNGNNLIRADNGALIYSIDCDWNGELPNYYDIYNLLTDYRDNCDDCPGGAAIYQYDVAITTQTTTRHTASGVAWEIDIDNPRRSSDFPVKLKVAEVLAEADSAVTVTCYVKKSHATNIAAKLIIPTHSLEGSTSDAEDIKADDTDWEQLSVSFTPTRDGAFAVYVYAWVEAAIGDVYVDDVAVSQA